MAFHTKEFPNKVFDSFEEYYACIDLKKRIAERLKTLSGEKRTRLVKALRVIKKDDPILQSLYQWILKFLKTSS